MCSAFCACGCPTTFERKYLWKFQENEKTFDNLKLKLLYLKRFLKIWSICILLLQRLLLPPAICSGGSNSMV